MDALQERELVNGHDVDLNAGGVADRAVGRRPLLGRGWLAAALAALGIVTSAWLSFVELPLSISVVGPSDGATVQSVGVGSYPWLEGIRPTMQAVSAEDGRRVRVIMPSGQSAGYALHRTGNFGPEVMLGLAIVLGAGLTGAARLPGSAAAAGAGVAIALAPALPHLGFPAAIPLVLLSLATAAAAVRIPNRRSQRRFDAFSLIVLGASVAFALMTMNGLNVDAWHLVWAAPLGVAIGLGTAGELVAVRARLVVTPVAGQGRAPRLLGAFVPLAARSRLEGAEEERSQLGIELHNRVLPQLTSSARAMREQGSPEEAADRLDELAEELRGVMQRHQTVSLQIAGVADALRADVETMSTAGMLVAFEVRDDGRGRPPAGVELAAYRIGQAAIDNALRHSGGERVDVSITTLPDRLELVVRDDGVGIDDKAETNARRSGRIGLAQMWLRAEAVGGSLDIRGHAGEGTEVRFQWTA